MACFLIYYPFFEVLTEVIHSFLKSGEYLYSHYFKLFIQVSCLTLVSFSSFSEVFFCFFSLKHISLSPHFVYLSVFVSIS